MTPDHVEVANNKLSAKCRRCNKTISYKRGTTLGKWNNSLRDFKLKHWECLPGKTNV